MTHQDPQQEEWIPRCRDTWEKSDLQPSSCYRPLWENHDQCIWHAEVDEDTDKPIEELQEVRPEKEIRQQNLGEGSNCVELFDDAKLANVEFGDELSFNSCSLRDADLSGAELGGADPPNANLQGANLSEANLRDADLSKANLREANLSEADLREADFSEADLREAKYSDADLRGADFSKLGKFYMGSSTDWNKIARTSHNLAAACSRRGLIDQARDLTLWERRARREEAIESNEKWEAIKSRISWQTTGYGISIRQVIRNMVFLFVVATFGYLLIGINGSFVRTLYYSIVTFTTTPPFEVNDDKIRLIAMFQAFFGTLLIVLLGYVLGNRGSL